MCKLADSDIYTYLVLFRKYRFTEPLHCVNTAAYCLQLAEWIAKNEYLGQLRCKANGEQIPSCTFCIVLQLLGGSCWSLELTDVGKQRGKIEGSQECA